MKVHYSSLFDKIQSIILFTWDCLLHRTGRSGDLRALPAIQKLSIMTFVLGRSAKLKKKMRIDLDITQGGSADRGTSSIALFRLSWHNLGVELAVSSIKHESARWWWHINTMLMTWSRRSPDKKVLHHWFPLLLNLRFPQTLGTDQKQWWWLCWC